VPKVPTTAAVVLPLADAAVDADVVPAKVVVAVP
jgi:hypothetical protein